MPRRHCRCWKRSEADPSADPAGDRFQLGLRRAELREDRFGMGDERFGGLGQAHATGHAFEEVHAVSRARADICWDTADGVRTSPPPPPRSCRGARPPRASPSA